MEKIENFDIGHVKRGFLNNFKIKITEVTDDKAFEIDLPHRHNFYMCCLIISGSGEHVIDFEKIEIKANRLFFLKPQQVHFWKINQNSRLAAIQFSIDFLVRLYTLDSIPAINSTLSPFIDLSDSDAHAILDIFKIIETENKLNDYSSDKIIQAQIFTMLAMIERLSVSQVTSTKGNKTEILNSFKRLLSDHYKDLTTISEHSSLLNITPNYLNIVVKECTGKTANELIHQRVLLEAKRLLIHKNSDITQIAYELGFKDASYFSRFFKKATGASPSYFRSNIDKMYLNSDK